MIDAKHITALVPMKAHSERVPNKNVRPFFAEPLYFRILHALENAASVDEIFVNTDSEQILREAPRHFEKVRVFRRPEGLRGDAVSMNLILAEDLKHTQADIYLQTHSTNPLLSTATIEQALTQFARQREYDSLFTVNRYQSRFYDARGQALNHDPNKLLRTQDLEPLYEENSCLYLFTRASFAATGARIGTKPMLFETPRIESIDIDDPESWALAEAVAAGLRQSGPGRPLR